MQPYMPLVPKLDAPRRKATKHGAVMAIIYAKEDSPYLLLIERNTYKGAHSGQISFPGGKIEIGESPLTAAIRECHEEVGIDNNRYMVLSPLTEVFVWASNFMVYPFLAISDNIGDMVADIKEVKTIIECPLSYFFDNNNKSEKMMKSYLGISLMAPYYKIHDVPLWGATAMMISEIESLLNTDY